MYRKILLTLDGSDAARTALPHARDIAATAGAEVVLLEVIDSVGHLVAQTTPAGFEPMPSGRIATEIAESAVSAQREAAEAYLTDVKAEFEAGGVSSVTVRVVEGNPSDAIVATVGALGCDLVVMATHGRSGLGRALLGSVADHVVRHVHDAAVLLVRADEGDGKDGKGAD